MNILKMLKFIYKYIKKQRYLLIISFISLLLISLMQLLIPQISQTIIDKVIPNKDYQELTNQLILLLGLTIGIAVFNFISSYLISYVSQKAIVSLRQDLFKNVLNQDYSFFETQKTGDLMSRFTEDIKTIQDLISPSSLKLISNIFTFFIILVFMFKQDIKLTIYLTLTFPLLFILNRVFGKLIRKAFRKIRLSSALISNHLQTSFTSILLIKSFNANKKEIANFEVLNENNKNNLIQATKYQSLFTPSIDIFNTLGTIIVLGYGSTMIMQDKMSVGAIIAYLAYLKLLQSPMRDLSLLLSRLQQAIVSYERVTDLFNYKPAITSKKDALLLKDLTSNISLNNVSFAYKNQIPVLDNINFEIPYQKTTALVGLSGSGKSTITKLLMRLYDVTSGTIKFDGIDIKDFDIASLRNKIGIVTQEIELIDGSIKDNIIYNQTNISNEDLDKACIQANIYEFIQSLEDKYETQVGERGIKLSGGQKQRIAIARVFLKQATILILDEATASLDNESEKSIQKALEALMYNRTTLVIAHRLSTIHKADNIIVLDKGHIIEQGNHNKLLDKKGRYYQLYQAQFE